MSVNTSINTVDRTKFIGASEIAAVMGLSRWKTPLRLWAEKTGKIEPQETGEAAEWGKRLEKVVAQKFSEKNNMRLMAYKKRFVHEEYPFISCELDQIVVGTDEIVEVKTCSAWILKQWEAEEVPLEYTLQVNFELGLSGRNVGYFAVLVGGQKYIERKVIFDQELYEKQVQSAVVFWNEFVLKDVPPKAQAEDNEENISLIYSETVPNKLTFEGDEALEINALLKERASLKASIDRAETEIDRIEVRIKELMAENEEAETDQYKVSWKNQNQTRVNTEKLREAGLYEKYAETKTIRKFTPKSKEKK